MSMVITGTGPMWDYQVEYTHPNQDYYDDIKSVTIEEGCTYIGEYAFDLMTNMTTVTIPSSVIEIGEGAFSYCWRLSSINLTRGLKTIGDLAFEFCRIPGESSGGLESITIPSTVTYIGSGAFQSCRNMQSIKMESSTPPAVTNPFTGIPKTSCILYVPAGSKSAYQSAEVWCNFTNIVEYERPDDYVAGDTNGDGKVLIGDVIAMLNYILGARLDNFNTMAADVNGDGKILIGDVIAVLNIIVNQ